MARTTSDVRVVRISVTRLELNTLLGNQAQQTGLIDFAPDTTEIMDQGEAGFEVIFTKDTQVIP
jgi:hypothetical protein